MRDRFNELGAGSASSPSYSSPRGHSSRQPQRDLERGERSNGHHGGHHSSSSSSSKQPLEVIATLEKLIASMDADMAKIQHLQRTVLNSTNSQDSPAHDDLNHRVEGMNKKANYIRLERIDKSHPDYHVVKRQKTNLATKFRDALVKYQQIQVTYQNDQRDRAERQYKIANPRATPDEIARALDSPDPIFAQRMVASARTSEARHALNEVQRRHEELVSLNKTIQETQQLFLDMQTMVEKQDELVLEVTNHASEVAKNTEKATMELKTAVVTAKKNHRRRWMILCCCLILLIVLGVVLYLKVIAPMIEQNNNKTNNNNDSTASTR